MPPWQFRSWRTDPDFGTLLGVVYFGKSGSDTLDGLTMGGAKLTIGAALAAAQSGTTNGTSADASASNICSVYGLDAGIYSEAVSIPDYVNLIAPYATIQGVGITNPALTIGSGCTVSLFKVASTAEAVEGLLPNSAILKTAAGFSFVDVRHVHNGPGGAGIGSLAATGALHAKAGIIHVAANSFGCGGGLSGSFGHLHIYVGDIYFEGNGGIGVVAGFNVGTGINVVGHVEHLLDFGGPWTGTTAFAALDADVTVGRIVMSADYVAAETLAVVQTNSYLRVTLADGRTLGMPTHGVLTGDETVTINVAGVTQELSLTDLKTFVTAP